MASLSNWPAKGALMGKLDVRKWQEYYRFIPSVYRFLALTIAGIQIFVFPSALYPPLLPQAIIIGLGIYTIFKALHPYHWYEGILGFTLIGIDVAVCFFLVISTGGLDSPFLLYTLSPVLTAALFLNESITFIIVGLLGASIIGCQVGNPLITTRWSVAELRHCLIYIVALSLIALLPFLVNVNLRQRMRSQDILQERQRLSREIHDGIIQTLTALRWQIQLTSRHLANMGIDPEEVRQLRSLADKAVQDTRETLELLRNYVGGDGSFIPHLETYLEHLRQDSNIHFRLDNEAGNLLLDPPVELELLRICQEALTNIRLHSGARNVQAKVSRVDGRVRVSIADDGYGFDASACLGEGAEAKGHGLTVMRERAESVQGELRVLSIPKRGTEIQVEVPTRSNRGKLP